MCEQQDKEAYWFLFDGDRLQLTKDGGIPLATVCPDVQAVNGYVQPLPPLNGKDCRAMAINASEGGEDYRVVDLRSSFDILPFEQYQMAGKARELLHWDAGTKFCCVCGGEMVRHTDISKRCCKCGKEVWPLLTTAIIVAVTRGRDEILLVQSNKFKSDYMGLVAGFVETGETLEECVRREVMEETNISIKNITYFKSQPWPYPRGLMVGFKAEYAGGDVRIQRSELNKGGWYRRDAMPAIPGKVSLARQLIDDWLNADS